MSKPGLVFAFFVIYCGTLLASGQIWTGSGPPLPPARRPFPPLLPPVPPQELIDRLTKAQLAFIRHHQEIRENDKSDYSPYACLPKYICIVEDEHGKKRTTIVNGLHPVLRENAFDRPYRPGNEQYEIQHSDPMAELRDQQRLSEDLFLRDQEMADRLALQQQNNRLINYAQTQHASKRKPKPTSGEESTEADTNSGESNESNSVESGEKPEKTKRPGAAPQQSSKPTTTVNNDQMNIEYDFGNNIASVPWDDRRNKTQQQQQQPPPPPNIRAGPGGLMKYGNMKYVLPLPSLLPSIFKQSPIQHQQHVQQQPQQQPSKGILRRMLGLRRKRDISSSQGLKNPFLTKLGPGIKSSDQCRILYNGCELTYDQIMQIADQGQVLIEGEDAAKPEKNKGNKNRPKVKPEDDEAEQAIKESAASKSPSTKPFVKPLNNKKPGSYQIKYKKKKDSKYGDVESNYNKDTKRPPDEEENDKESEEDETDTIPVASLPVLPMRFTWGKPQVYINGKPQYPEILGVDARKPTAPPTPPPPTTPAPPTPIFVKNPVYKKVNRTRLQTNVVKLNATHALQIKTPNTKPYRPYKTPLADKNGNPSSFASVFSEIAGSSGGMHDYFDKIANVVGSQPKRKTKQFPAPPPTKPKNPPTKPKPKKSEEDDDGDDVDNSEEEDEEQQDEEEQAPTNQGESSKESKEDEAEDDEPETIDAKIKESSKTKKKEKPKPKEKEEVEKMEDDEDETADDEKTPDANENEKVQEDDAEEADDDDAEENDDKAQEPEVADDLADGKGQESKTKDKVKGGKKKNKNKQKEIEEESEEEDTSEEKRKRIKAAAEVQLPHFLPESVKQAIRQDIINGGKKKKKPQAPGAAEPLGYHPQNNNNNGRPGRPQSQFNVPPRGGGLFSSIFG